MANNKFLGFRFNTCNGFDHLSCAIAYNAVADNLRTKNPLEAGSTVSVLAKKGDRYMVAAGVATGNLLPHSPKEVWDTWETEGTVVHEVLFVTRPVLLPYEMGKSCSTTAIKTEDAEKLAVYALTHG